MDNLSVTFGDDANPGLVVTGASLTSQAVNDGTRKALAIFHVCLKES